MGKKFWLSKTFYVNLLAIGAIIYQYVTETELLNPEAQVLVLAVLNLILRKLTNQPLDWK